MKFFHLSLLACLAILNSSAATIQIGSEALLSTTTDQEYFARMSRKPASNSVQRLNPPIFQYPYYEDPGSLTNLGQTRVFRLQVTTNGSFSSPLWDITTSNIFYNFLPSITNADGSTWSNTVSWRVIYMNSNQTVNLYTNPVHTFTMPADATKWDRACFADSSPGGFLQSLSNVHPRVLFKSTNINTLRALVNNGLSYFGDIGQAATFLDLTNSYSILSDTLWTNDFLSLSNNPNWYFLMGAVERLGGAYWTVTNAWFTNGVNAASPSVGTVMTNWCALNETLGFDRIEAYGGNYYGLHSLPMAYDYFYHLLTTEQRAIVLRQIENWAAFYVYEGWYYYGSQTNLDRVYGGRNLAMNIPSVAIQQDSHGRHDRMALINCLAGMGDSPKLDYYAQWFLGFYMGKFDGFDYSFEDPRIYGGISTIMDFDRAFKPWVLANTMFNDKGLSNAPVYHEMANVQVHQTPIGFRSLMQPWGPAANYVITDPDQFTGRYPFSYAGYALFARISGRGDIQREHERAVELGHYNGEGVGADWMIQMAGSFWPKPTAVDRETNSYIDAVRGWATGSDHRPTDYGAGSNAVFFVFCARPTGMGRSGGSFSDGNIEIGAYGANVTAAGAGRYEIAATFMNGLFVDGIGVNNSSPTTLYPIHARFDAFTNWGDGVYVRADLTHDMNLGNYALLGGTANVQSYPNSPALHDYLQASNARPYIASIKRSILSPHNKFFVIYDQLQTTQAAMFQWKWNAYPTNCTLMDTSDFSFHYTVTNNWPGRSNVTVYVRHIVNPGLMGVTQMVNAAENPVGTNEFCYAKMNPFSGESYAYTNDWPGVGNDYQDPYWSNTIWVYNKTLATNWHFLSVVFPVKPGDAAPTIVRKDDYTVAITNGAVGDVISYDTNNVTGGAGAYAGVATIVVDEGATNAPPSPPPVPVQISKSSGNTKLSGNVRIQ